LRFFGHEIHIGKDDDADDGLFRNLRAPTGFGTSVIAFAFFESELEQELDEIDEMFARAAEGVMVVIAPPKAELVLAPFLNLGGAIARFPISALGCEEEFTRKIASDEVEALVENLVSSMETLVVIWKKPTAGVPELFGSDDPTEISRI